MSRKVTTTAQDKESKENREAQVAMRGLFLFTFSLNTIGIDQGRRQYIAAVDQHGDQVTVSNREYHVQCGTEFRTSESMRELEDMRLHGFVNGMPSVRGTGTGKLIENYHGPPVISKVVYTGNRTGGIHGVIGTGMDKLVRRLEYCLQGGHRIDLAGKTKRELQNAALSLRDLFHTKASFRAQNREYKAHYMKK